MIYNKLKGITCDFLNKKIIAAKYSSTSSFFDESVHYVT